jgi:hypothetical protein
MLRRIGKSRIGKRAVALLLAVSVLIPVAAPLQVVSIPDGECAVLMTLNVCESGDAIASGQTHFVSIPEAGFCGPPPLSPEPSVAREQTFPVYVLLTTIDRPPQNLRNSLFVLLWV